MDTNRAPARCLRTFAFAALALVGGPALAAGNCTVKADANPPALSIPDFTALQGGGYARTQAKLNGSASKPEVKDGGIYNWSYISGPAGYALTDANQPQASFVPADVGPAGATYVIRLTVTGCGSSEILDYAVRVTDAYSVVSNSAPHAVAAATPNPATEGQTVILSGVASYDPDPGTTLTYQWQQTSGPALALANANSASASFIAPNVPATTTYQFRLTVSDGTLTDASTVNVNVSWTNDPPVARLTCPLDVNEGQPVTLDGSGSTDGDDGIASYRWVQKSGLPVVAGVGDWTTSRATFDAPALGYLQTGEIGFTLFATDNSGAEASKDCDIFIHDVTAPIVSVSDMSADADSAAGADAVAFVPAPTAFDAVDGDLTYKLACVPPSGSAFPMGSSDVTCGTMDSAGNFGSSSFKVTVADLSAPVIAAHADIAMEATGPSGADVSYDPPATSDKVDGAGVATCTPPPGIFALGSTTVACNASDKVGNAATPTSFVVTVMDTTPPTLSLPANITAEATSPAGATVTYSASASDLVSGNVPVTCSPVSGSTFALGITPVHCSATDAASNEANGEFNVTVRDTTPPSIAPHGDVTVEATSAAGAVVNYALPATSDIVDGAGFASCAATPGTQFPLGTSVVTCSATDNAGNIAASTTFKVIVRDTTPPAIATHGDVIATATANSQAVVSYTAPSANDLVDGTLETTCVPASGSTFNVGTTAVTCSVTDAAGNTATSTFNVIVNYAFDGFFRPVDRLPTVNVVKAGQAIPVKFSLGGNQGLAIFAAGYPKVVAMACSGAVQDAVEETVTAGGSSLQYDATTGQYIYVWKSDKSWAGSCRQLQVKFADGTTQVANFSFTR
jgi:hypothetical protein